MHTGFKSGHHFEYLDVDGSIILKLMLETWDGRAWISFMWLRTGATVGLFLSRCETPLKCPDRLRTLPSLVFSGYRDPGVRRPRLSN